MTESTPARRAVLHTNHGDITVDLFPDHAPKTVANFADLAEGRREWTHPATREKTTDRLYDGTVFHRVISNFMIQGGGFDVELKERKTRDPIKNESGNGVPNKRGYIAMARTRVLDSATSQFYINVVDNPSLDRGQYCAFGRVLDGIVRASGQ